MTVYYMHTSLSTMEQNYDVDVGHLLIVVDLSGDYVDYDLI